MNSNKKITLLFIILFIILIGIGFYILKLKPKNDSSTTIIEENETQEEINSTPIEKSEKNETSKTEIETTSTKNSQQNETPKNEIETKIPISQARFDEIKRLVLSLDDISSISDLSTNEKTKIEEIRIPYKKSLQREQDRINEYIKICNEIDKKLEEIETKKSGLELQQEIQTTLKNEKEAEIEQKKEELAKSRNTKSINPEKLKDEISQLQDEKMKIIMQIYANKLEIDTCENEKPMYTDMLKRANESKQKLEDEFNNFKETYNINSSLNEIYQFTN